MFKREGSTAKEVFARLWAKHPELAELEKSLGSRLVVGDNVARLRMRLGYTQTRLARELGVTQPRIAQIEGFEANLQLDTLDRIAAFFGVDPAALLTKHEPAPAAARPQDRVAETASR